MLSTSLGPVFALVMAAVLTSGGDAAERALKLDVIVSALPSSTVSINCSFDPSLASMKTVNELKVFGSKPNSKKQDFQSFASVDRWNPDAILFSGAGRDGVDLIGSFGFESDISELALSWASPSLTSGLRYKCAAQGTDHNGQIVTISETTKIDDTTVEFSSLAKDMSLLSDYVKKTLNDIQRDLNAVKNKVNSNVDDISDLQNAVDTSVNTSKQMAKKLTAVPLKTDFSKLKDRVNQMDKLVSDHSKSIVLLSAMRDFHLSLTFQDNVYMASKYESYFDFSDADSQCEAIGGYLAEINTFSEFSFVANFLYALDSQDIYFIGANDKKEKGKFTFFHSKKPMPGNLWPRGQPSISRTKNCVAIDVDTKSLKTISCNSNPVNFLCEVPLE